MGSTMFQGLTGRLIIALLFAGCASELVVERGGDSLRQEPDAAPEAGADERLWTACDNQGDMFKAGRTGDRCNFGDPCGDTEGCRITTADCSAGVLRITTAEACSGAAPTDTTCARVTEDPCCVALTQCGAANGESTVCSLGCDGLRSDAQADTVVRCSPSVPQAVGAPCEGDFVCGSDGGDLAQSAGRLNSYGEMYWCGAGVLQKGVTGPSFVNSQQ